MSTIIPMGRYSGSSLENRLSNTNEKTRNDFLDYFEHFIKTWDVEKRKHPNVPWKFWNIMKTRFEEMDLVVNHCLLTDALRLRKGKKRREVLIHTMKAIHQVSLHHERIPTGEYIKVGDNDTYVGQFIGITKSNNIKFQVNTKAILCLPRQGVVGNYNWMQMKKGSLFKVKCKVAWRSSDGLYTIGADMKYFSSINKEVKEEDNE